MNKILFVITSIVLAFASCNRSDSYIIPVDYEKYNDGVASRSEKENQELTMRLYMDWYHNTVGKEIPDIRVKDLEGKSIRLKKWLKRETILIFTDTYCSFGGEEVEQDFPNAINNMKDELEGIDILCLVELSEDSDLQKTVEYAKTLQGKYDNIFIIDQKDALRSNLAAAPTKFFIDKKQIVRHIQMGFTFDENGSEYSIRQGIMMMRKEKQKQ
ncbi:MAG: redoxin domain-containing protein [Bacteroidales bacterium]|nr:redoxin domain-containing protein [Bacteroidales bacterium]